MTGLYIFIALIAIALLGWAVAELKSRSITFEHSEEREEAELLYNEQKERDFKEQDLKDLLAHNSTEGYDAI